MFLLKDPLLHFLVIGALLFGLYFLLDPEAFSDPAKIVVTPGDITLLEENFVRLRQREPSPEELRELIDNYVNEEIYYREALAMGLDENDSVIRRRLRQKMEFITKDISNLYKPTTAELEQYLQNNTAKFQRDTRFSFRQVFVNTDKFSGNVSEELARIAQRLNENKALVESTGFLQAEYTLATEHEVTRIFGEAFTKQLFRQTIDVWSKPIQSQLGTHFVKLEQIVEGELPQLDSIYQQVYQEWLRDKNQAVQLSILGQLKSRYEIIINNEETSSL